MSRKSENGHSAKPTILFVISSLCLGGAEQQMLLLISNLIELKFDCHLFVLEAWGPLRKKLNQLNIKVFDGGYDSTKSKITKILYLIRAQLLLIRSIRTIKPDILHSYLPLTNFMGSFAGRVSGVPLVINSKRALGTHQERNKIWKIIDIAAFRLSHCATVNSQAVGEDTINRDKGDKSKIRLIYNGLNPEVFNIQNDLKRDVLNKLGINPEKRIVITVANLIPYKGHIDLIRAAAEVAEQFDNSVFLLVGEDRGIKNRLDRQVQELGIENTIQFLGLREDIPRLMAASEISVLPSHEEGFSNVILESMAASLPVVATHVGGNPEAVVQGETGWLVPPKNPEELAKKIIDLLNDPEKAKKWGKVGRHRVEKNFTHQKMVAEHIKLYNQTIQI